jgi:hypothetical protein
MDVTQLGDFKKYYDSKLKTNYWVLGYFGGGSIYVQEAWEAAKQFAECTGVDISTVRIIEINQSRRFKHFKVLYSIAENQMPEKDSSVFDKVWDFLTD